jgi:EAL domain-containing protein (putative c-di-GMP-specific phosphodiesterase class I)
MAEWGSTNASTASGFSGSEESALLDRLKRIENNSAGYFAVHTHLSDLRSNNKQSHFIQIAVRTFETLLESNDATLYSLSNLDLVLICRNIPVDEVDQIIDKVRALFSEDPLADIDESGFEDNFSTWHDLSSAEDFASFLSIIAGLSLEAERDAEEAARISDQEKSRGDPLTPNNLADLNKKILNMPIADLIQVQTCLLVRTGGAGEVVFRENFISMGQVRERIAPNIDFFGNPWLFQYLTESLDRRLLAVLSERDHEDGFEPISLNLNISTVLSRDFQRFHKVIGRRSSEVVVEMQVIDVFADPKNYGYARDSLQERGYRVLIDGLDPQSLQYFDPTILRADLLKISWSNALQGNDSDERAAEIKEVITQVGKNSVILARVDTEKAVKWGLSLGISRFQGFFIDRLAEIFSSGKSL